MKSHTRYSSTYFKDIYNALKPRKPVGGKKASVAKPSAPTGSAVFQRGTCVLRPAVIVTDKVLTSPHAENTNERFDNAASPDTTSQQIGQGSSQRSVQNQPARQTEVRGGNFRRLQRATGWKTNGKSKESLNAQAHLTMVFQRGQSGISLLAQRLDRVISLTRDLECAHREIAGIKSQLDDLHKPSQSVKSNHMALALQDRRTAAAERIVDLLNEVRSEGKAFELEVERFNNSLTAQTGTHGANPAISPTLNRLNAESQEFALRCKQLCSSAFNIAKSAADYAPHTRLSRLVELDSDTQAEQDHAGFSHEQKRIPSTTPKAATPEGDLSESLVEDDADDLAKDFSNRIAIDAKNAGVRLARMTEIAESMESHAMQLQNIESNIQIWLKSYPDQARATADAHYASYKAESEQAIKLGREQLGQLHRELLAIVSKGAELTQCDDVRKDIGTARQEAKAHYVQLNGLLTQANELVARAPLITGTTR